MTNKLRSICWLLFFWLTTTTSTVVVVHAFGGSNIFGVFRKRRRTLQDVQEKRVEVAARRGFAGPHGELLTIQEFTALPQERATTSRQEEQQHGVWGQVLHVLDRFSRRPDDE